jgi:PhoPQ-activated pathogenicity-related protein
MTRRSEHGPVAAGRPGPAPAEFDRRTFLAQAAAGGLTAAGWSALGSNAALEAGEAAATLAPAAATTTKGVLATYAHAADPATDRVAVAGGAAQGARWQTLLLTSQRWRDVAWRHEVSLVLPDGLPDGPTPMLLWIDGGRDTQLPALNGQARPSPALPVLTAVAKAARLPAAVIRQIPFQPMFGDLVEDALIAHSFGEFVRTGDATWPLLLPMVKAAVEGMNAAEEAASAAWGVDVSGFVVAGASKRGWTTWLTSAVDPRVKGLVPIVIDMLSLPRHLELQRASFGGRLSEKLDDYTTRGLEQLVAMPRGDDLLDIVDPYSYRESIPQPKVIALGTNDPYWPLGAVDLYYDGLAGPRWLSYCPNGGHGLPPQRIGGLVAALGRHVSGAEPLPEVRWSFADDGGTTHCRLTASARPRKLVLWQAEAATRDFRQSAWRSTEVAITDDLLAGGQAIRLADATAPWSAALVECEYPREALPLALTTSVRVRQG